MHFARPPFSAGHNMNRKRKSLRSPLPASILPGDATRQEALRLLLQAAVYDPLTRRFLSDAGLQRGMRVLEVGSGPGSMSLLVSELVGRKGMVVGVEYCAPMVDLARRRARKAGRTNIEFVQADIETANLTGPFNAVIGRFIVRELKDSAKLLGRLSHLLAPCGIVAFQEKIIAVPVASVPPLRAVDKAWGWMDEVRRRAGVDVCRGC